MTHRQRVRERERERAEKRKEKSDGKAENLTAVDNHRERESERE